MHLVPSFDIGIDLEDSKNVSLELANLHIEGGNINDEGRTAIEVFVLMEIAVEIIGPKVELAFIEHPSMENLIR